MSVCSAVHHDHLHTESVCFNLIACIRITIEVGHHQLVSQRLLCSNSHNRPEGLERVEPIWLVVCTTPFLLLLYDMEESYHVTKATTLIQVWSAQYIITGIGGIDCLLTPDADRTQAYDMNPSEGQSYSCTSTLPNVTDTSTTSASSGLALKARSSPSMSSTPLP